MNDPRRPADLAPRAMLSGRSAFLSLLASEGIDVMFGNPGTTELAIMEALGQQSDINYVLGLQEALVVAMADGYARASNRLAACNVHVAPGLGNAMGSLYTAKIYGSPVLVTAGQQEQGHGLKEPMLYDSLVPMAQPMVKWAVEVTRVEDLPRIVRRAAKVAMTPPTGPVFISLPGDILDAQAELDLGRPTRVDAATRPSDAALVRLADALLSARNPAIVAGHELCTSDALQEAGELAEVLGAAVYQQTVNYGAHFLSEHPAFVRPLTRNQQQVRDWLSPYDMLVFLGSDQLRMSVHSPVEPLPEGARVVQIGNRDWELAKNYPAEIALRADVKETLRALLPVLRSRMTAEQAGAIGAPACRACGQQLDCAARTHAAGRAEGRGRASDGSTPADAAADRSAAARRSRGGRGAHRQHFVPQSIPGARCALLLRAGERGHRLRDGGSGWGQPGVAGSPGHGHGRRRQRDVQHPGAVDRGPPETADHLCDREQSQLPDPQGTAAGRCAAASATSGWIYASRRSTLSGWRSPWVCRPGALPTPTRWRPRCERRWRAARPACWTCA